MGTTILGATYEADPADGDAISGGPTDIRAVKSDKRKHSRGELQISITNLGTDDTNMKIEVGSVFEVNGVLIEIITADEPTEAFTITDITDETVGYVYVTAAGAFSIAETAPTWDAAKQGWYNSNSRAIAGFTRDGSNYDSKFIVSSKEGDIRGVGIATDSAVKGTFKVDGIEEQGSNAEELQCTILEIGDWNMDSTDSVTVTLGITYTKVRAMRCTIRGDFDTGLANYIYTFPESDNTIGSYIRLMDVGGTWKINLVRVAAGRFDSQFFDKTSYNRGWIQVWHTP